MEEIDVGRFAQAFEVFLERFRDALPEQSHALRRLAAEHLGADPAELPVFTERFDASEHPNLQLALDAVLADAGPWRLFGLPAELHQYGGFSLASLLAGRFHGPTDPCAPEFVQVPVDVERTLPCLRLGVYLLSFDDTPLVAMVGFSEGHGPSPGLSLDVVCARAEQASGFVAAVRRSMHEHNVYRGKVLSFAFSEWGGFGITFHTLPTIPRAGVVLPEDDLAAIERHVIGVSDHAAALRASGRHLKRGLLLYGPPGTGKTLSIMYLCSRLADRTIVLLSGPGAGALGQAAAIARSLQPSMVVVEDVDLVAMERTMPGMGTNPMLFQLLNEMDGLNDDADVVFVLTTNRVELLEPALAARPGRIDQAVEIRLPDADLRRRLLELYLQGAGWDGGDLATIVDGTEGVTASFMKELVRRAALESVLDRADATDATVPTLTTTHLEVALSDLMHHSAPVLLASLGARPGGPLDIDDDVVDVEATSGWVAFGPSPAPYLD